MLGLRCSLIDSRAKEILLSLAFSVWLLCLIFVSLFFGAGGVKPDEHLESHTVIDMRSVTRKRLNLGNLSVEFF